VSIDFPDKLYMGGFGRDAVFEARAEDDGVLIRLVRGAFGQRQARGPASRSWPRTPVWLPIPEKAHRVLAVKAGDRREPRFPLPGPVRA
jgi:hypothetical protein